MYYYRTVAFTIDLAIHVVWFTWREENRNFSQAVNKLYNKVENMLEQIVYAEACYAQVSILIEKYANALEQNQPIGQILVDELKICKNEYLRREIEQKLNQLVNKHDEEVRKILSPFIESTNLYCEYGEFVDTVFDDFFNVFHQAVNQFGNMVNDFFNQFSK